MCFVLLYEDMINSEVSPGVGAFEDQRSSKALRRDWVLKYRDIDPDNPSLDFFSKPQEAHLASHIKSGAVAEELLKLSFSDQVNPDEQQSIESNIGLALAKSRIAKQALIETNLGFARMIALESAGITGIRKSGGRSNKRIPDLRSCRLDLEQRYSAALEGLAVAANGFRPAAANGREAASFPTFAAYAIRYAIEKDIEAEERNDTVPFPEDSNFTDGQPPDSDTAETFADICDRLLDHGYESEAIVQRARAEAIAVALTGLDPRFQAIIIDRFGLAGNEPMTLKELGERYNEVTATRISQIIRRAISQLLSPPISRELADFR